MCRTIKHPRCSQCDAVLDPARWDDCEKYYIVGGEIYCSDCFKDWALDWMETNLDDLARAIDVPVVEVL